MGHEISEPMSILRLSLSYVMSFSVPIRAVESLVSSVWTANPYTTCRNNASRTRQVQMTLQWAHSCARTASTLKLGSADLAIPSSVPIALRSTPDQVHALSFAGLLSSSSGRACSALAPGVVKEVGRERELEARRQARERVDEAVEPQLLHARHSPNELTWRICRSVALCIALWLCSSTPD